MDSKENAQHEQDRHNSQRDLYRIGAAAALMAVVLAVAEISITFFPGGTSVATVTVVDWLALLQTYPFMGMRNLGLLNMGFNALAVPAFLALYAAHRNANRLYAALAMVTAFIGVAVFFATNRALPMLDLSHQYAAATSNTQKASLVAAGQAMLAVGQSHTPGTFLAFLFSEVAGILMSVAMLRGGVFGKANAYLGVLGFALLLVFEVLASFVGALDGVATMLAMPGGLLNLAWYVLLARRLLQLAGNAPAASADRSR
jgi:hypothetical protein